jgi:hypothetical protein
MVALLIPIFSASVEEEECAVWKISGPLAVAFWDIAW